MPQGAGLKEEMLIGRSDDPKNPGSLVAINAAHPLGSGSRNPSGPADSVPRKTGRTHDCYRTRSDFLAFNPCIQGAVHTRATACYGLLCLWQGVDGANKNTKLSQNSFLVSFRQGGEFHL